MRLLLKKQVVNLSVLLLTERLHLPLLENCIGIGTASEALLVTFKE